MTGRVTHVAGLTSNPAQRADAIRELVCGEMARHSAGQGALDKTGNLKAVQKLLGHSSIQTTGDIYADWDIDALTRTMTEVLSRD